MSKKSKHNKKRNTAFLYEALIRELTKSVIEQDKNRQAKVVSICKQYFCENSLLKKEKDLYFCILESFDLSKESAEKILSEVLSARKEIDNDKLFQEQTKLIHIVNKELGNSVFSNFIPGYKNLATIAQIFAKNCPIKDRVLLENSVVEKMTAPKEEQGKTNLQSIDKLTFKTFTEKFNEKYSNTLKEEQKKLITKYVMSFGDNGVELKYFLNEELGRLKGKTKTLLRENAFMDDNLTKGKLMKMLELLESMVHHDINDTLIERVLLMQEFVSLPISAKE